MSKYKVGDTVYFSPVHIFAGRAVILAVRERKWLPDLYLLRDEDVTDDPIRLWTNEDTLDPIGKVK